MVAPTTISGRRGEESDAWGFMVGEGREGCTYPQNSQKIRPKPPPKKWVWGPPGRGVLRFLAGGYRNPVHIFVKNSVFSENLQI